MKYIIIALTLLLTSSTLYAWEGVVIHHTDSDKMSLSDCNDWHNEKGWNGCGYNYVFQRDGTIDTARGMKIGAHARGRNRTHLGVALVGRETFTASQIQALKGFLKGRGLPIEPHHEKCPTDEWAKLKKELI